MLTFIFGVLVGGAAMVYKNRLTRLKEKITKAIDEEMKGK